MSYSHQWFCHSSTWCILGPCKVAAYRSWQKLKTKQERIRWMEIFNRSTHQLHSWLNCIHNNFYFRPWFRKIQFQRLFYSDKASFIFYKHIELNSLIIEQMGKNFVFYWQEKKSTLLLCYQYIRVLWKKKKNPHWPRHSARYRMPSRMSSRKKRITLATLLNRNKLPKCCSTVTENDRREEQQIQRWRETRSLCIVHTRSEGGQIRFTQHTEFSV